MQTNPTLVSDCLLMNGFHLVISSPCTLTFQALGVYCQLNVNHLRTCVSIEKPNTRASLTLIMKVSGMQLVHIQASGTLVNNVDPGACVCVQLVMFSFSWLASSALQTR